MYVCLQLCIDRDSISLVASIPSIPQGFALSSDVIFAKVYYHNHTSLDPFEAHVWMYTLADGSCTYVNIYIYIYI